MKKQILSFALVAAMIGTIATSCSSEKKAGDGSDSTKMDSTSQSAPTQLPASTDTTKTDTQQKQILLKNHVSNLVTHKKSRINLHQAGIFYAFFLNI
jgi:hypothetical protein